MSYDPDQRISRQEAVVLARTSVDTLRRLERNTADPLLRETDEDTRRATYRLGDLVDRGLIRMEDVTIAGSASDAAEVIKSRDTIAELRALVAEKEGRLAHADLLVATLTEQLAVKDRQITNHGTQINKLADVIARLGGAA